MPSERLIPALSIGLVISTIALTFIGSTFGVTIVPRYVSYFTTVVGKVKFEVFLFDLSCSLIFIAAI